MQPGPLVREEKNCLGATIAYYYDTAGARVHPWFDVATTEIIVADDSYTNGDGVSDSEAIPLFLLSQAAASSEQIRQARVFSDL